MTVTSEHLRRQRDQRERERQELAAAYDRAAKVLDAIEGEHREAVSLLRYEAKQWRER